MSYKHLPTNHDAAAHLSPVVLAAREGPALVGDGHRVGVPRADRGDAHLLEGSYEARNRVPATSGQPPHHQPLPEHRVGGRRGDKGGEGAYLFVAWHKSFDQ